MGGWGGSFFFVKFLLATPDWKYGVKNFDVFFIPPNRNYEKKDRFKVADANSDDHSSS